MLLNQLRNAILHLWQKIADWHGNLQSHIGLGYVNMLHESHAHPHQHLTLKLILDHQKIIGMIHIPG
ncbi:hypothetical protein P691DRAFT_769239 [Macrolepiota fuliginosa MF-IS2]|uniref:Uncharacterized protein n=1 Tax=Macrolepiota fuliginosa MF-IS2 TaxID=1400762 RepID=A0A9P6BVL0_9AGAR|nr:hypothetical protein P691DRAFT_769239 [Macrolepiota fuliginosa MF-IS2]